jgi:hypothetical protein
MRGVKLHPGSYNSSGIEELQRAVAAGFLTQAEARQVVLDMFPAARKLADARKVVEEASN